MARARARHAALLACALLQAVSANQRHIPDDFIVTSSAVAALAEGSRLQEVTTKYDKQLDQFFMGGVRIGWQPPLMFWLVENYWQQFLLPGSCLGPAGPLGALGPLSPLGPVSSPNSTARRMQKTIDEVRDRRMRCAGLLSPLPSSTRRPFAPGVAGAALRLLLNLVVRPARLERPAGRARAAGARAAVQQHVPPEPSAVRRQRVPGEPRHHRRVGCSRPAR